MPLRQAPQVLDECVGEGVVEGILVEDPGHELALLAPREAALEPALEPALDVVSLLLRDHRNANTRRAYAGNLRAFFAWRAGLDDPAAARENPAPEEVREFLAQSRRNIALDLTRYKAHLIERGSTEATINRHLSAIRALLKLAHRLEMCCTDGRGLVDGEKVEVYRDVHGLSLPEVQAMMALPKQLHGNSVKGLRDTALIGLLYENGLRRSTVCKLDVSDFSRPGRRLRVLNKGRGTQKQTVDISKELAGEIAAYLATAGHQDGALFRNVHHGAGIKGNRLTPDGLYKITVGYGEKIGIDNARPHRFRHSAGTLAAQATGGDMTKVQELLGHKNMNTSQVYVKVARNVQGEVTNLLSKMARGK